MNNADAQLIRQGNRRALAKAITLVESSLASHQQQAQELLQQILPYSGASIRVGITGSPGVGKSTFIEALGLYLIGQGKRVAILAVDPSSPIAGGSILGDKTRMENLSREINAFIRPSPSEGALGGVAHKTRETMLLCEAAGFDVILVETVGVGQSEYQVASMVDFFMVLMLPNAGDELQGIKKGIIELADALVINKADGESKKQAIRTQQQYQSAIGLLHHPSFWAPKVSTCSALENHNIDSVWHMIEEYREQAGANKTFRMKRASQNKQWMDQLISEMLEMKISQNPEVKEAKPRLEWEVIEGKTTPYAAAMELIDML